MRPAPKYGIVALAAVVLVALAATAAVWFLRDDAPDEVDLDDAVGAIAEPTTSVEGEDTLSDTVPDGDISGTWTVDSETGEFDYESATGSFAGFRIDEELAGIGATEAVGRTGNLTGAVVIDRTSVISADVEVDMTTISTNESRRDGRVQSALGTEQFPTATFSLTEPIELGEDAASGEPVSVTATGDLTIHGVTRRVQIPMEARLVQGTIVIVGSTEITFADFDVEVPSAPVVVSVSDVGTLELQLLLTRG